MRRDSSRFRSSRLDRPDNLVQRDARELWRATQPKGKPRPKRRSVDDVELRAVDVVAIGNIAPVGACEQTIHARRRAPMRMSGKLQFLAQAIDCLLLPALGIVPAVPPAPAKASKASKKVPGAYP